MATLRRRLMPAASEMGRTIFGQTPFYGWHYPPFFLLSRPLASSLSPLILWQGGSLLLYLGAAPVAAQERSALSGGDRLWLPLTWASPPCS